MPVKLNGVRGRRRERMRSAGLEADPYVVGHDPE